MKKVLSIILTLTVLMMVLAGCDTGGGSSSTSTPASGVQSSSVESGSEPVTGEGYSAGFVLLGLGSEFFQGMADTFVEMFTAAGWEANYTDGQFDPSAQIEAIENCTAMGVDVLVVFPSDGPPVDDALAKARDAGVKVIEMVNTGNNWDVAMISDDNMMAEYMNMMAAMWVEENFPDAEDGSIECVAVTYYSSEVNQKQSAVALEIENYSSKIKLVDEYELADETTEAGMTAAENIFTAHPNVNLLISPNGTSMIGLNNYLTSMNSPVTDFSNIGMFTCNGSGQEVYDAIAASGNDEAPLRGSVITGGIDATVTEILEVAQGLMDGSITTETRYSSYELVMASTVEDYMSTSTIASFTTDDIKEVVPHFYS